MIEFVERGSLDGFRSGGSDSLSEYIRASDDITFYRHYHAPLYFYWLGAVTMIVGNGEHTARLATRALLLLTGVSVYIACLGLCRRGGRVAGILGSCMLLFSPTQATTTSLITPHAMYVWAALMTLIGLSGFVRTRRLGMWYASAVGLALAVLSIEYAAILGVTMLLVLLVDNQLADAGTQKHDIGKLAIRSAAILGCVVAALWPGGLLRGTIVKNYAFFAYFAAVRGNTYGEGGVCSTWLSRIAASPIEYSLIVLSLVIFGYTVIWRGRLRWMWPFVAYALLMGLTTFRNRDTWPTYVSSMIAALSVLGAVTLADTLEKIERQWRVVLTIGVVSALLLGGREIGPSVEAQQDGSDKFTKLLSYFEGQPASNDELLVPQGLLPTLHYYLPQLRVTRYKGKDDVTSLRDKLSSDWCGGILYVGLPGTDLGIPTPRLLDTHESIVVPSGFGSRPLRHFYRACRSD